jgi:hypothetical protein
MSHQNKTYNKKLAERLYQIMNILDMTYIGFAEFTGRDVSHIYGIINQSRPFNDTFAEHIGNKLGIKGAKILNLNVSIPTSISKADAVVSFKKYNKDNSEYFLHCKTDRSIDAFVSEVLVKSEFLKKPRYLNEIECYIEKEYQKIYIGDQLSKALRYAVTKKTLQSEKKPIKLKNGNLGKRLIDVYWSVH